jgi:hypothetical protein
MPDARLPDWPAGLSERWAAKYIGVSQTTLRTLQAQGKIAKIPITKGRFVYRRVDLDRFLAKLAGEEQPDEVNEWEIA